MRKYELEFSINKTTITRVYNFFDRHLFMIVMYVLVFISVYTFIHYYQNGLGLAYNDARSHLNIGRRVVEGLKPGYAQLGSVWLPLPHVLMTFTIWNNFMWHTGLAGAIFSMISFVATGLIIYKFLEELGVGYFGRVFGVFIFVANINILYLQSTAMTELLLIATMTMASYELLLWEKYRKLNDLLGSALWIMLSTLVRYDGWFLLVWVGGIVLLNALDFNTLFAKSKNLKNRISGFITDNQKAEGLFVMFMTLASFGIFLWLLWNLLIFKDPLYFAFGPFSAKAQQDQLDVSGVLQTKHNLWLSIKFYTYALAYNSNAFFLIIAALGAIKMFVNSKLSVRFRLAASALLAPLVFNIVALYLGHSVLFIQGLSGDTWFNVRYGVMLMPAIAIFIAYLVKKGDAMRYVISGLVIMSVFFTFSSQDAVTIDDARVGSSQKNVTEVSGWLSDNVSNQEGFILISAASHDAIIFSSGLPMIRFIHEGTGLYWESAVALPDRWAKWIIMRTHDDNDLTFRSLKDSNWEDKYDLVDHFPFADIYQLKPEYWDTVNTKPVLQKQK